MGAFDSIKLAMFGRKFKCYICGKTSKGPESIYVSVGIRSSDGFEPPTEFAGYDWEKPKDLFKCKKCGLWVCPGCVVTSESLGGHVCKYCKPDWELKIEKAELQKKKDQEQK